VNKKHPNDGPIARVFPTRRPVGFFPDCPAGRLPGGPGFFGSTACRPVVIFPAGRTVDPSFVGSRSSLFGLSAIFIHHPLSLIPFFFSGRQAVRVSSPATLGNHKPQGNIT